MERKIKVVSMLFIIVISTLSCNTYKTSTKPDNTVKSNPEPSQVETAYFKAQGMDSPWTLSIDTTTIVFEMRGQKMAFEHTEPVRAMDANVKMYNLTYKGSKVRITIIQKECTPKDSQTPLPYTVTVNMSNDKNVTDYNGCGQYITDYRLYDIWALQEINGKKVTAGNFAKEIPSLEINTTTNTFGGYAGCNNIGGKIFSERSLLRFTDMISTLMACPGTMEDEFVAALQKTTSYKLKDNSLFLMSDGKTVLKFKKVD